MVKRTFGESLKLCYNIPTFNSSILQINFKIYYFKWCKVMLFERNKFIVLIKFTCSQYLNLNISYKFYFVTISF